jgi:hypothetical protein
MHTGNRWQDLLTGSFATGRTGNEVFALMRDAAAQAPFPSRVYAIEGNIKQALPE